MHIDLIGDYAGKELFLIDGDSLLRTSFEDSRIDFNGKTEKKKKILPPSKSTEAGDISYPFQPYNSQAQCSSLSYEQHC
jgi:hypothetical protein